MESWEFNGKRSESFEATDDYGEKFKMGRGANSFGINIEVKRGGLLIDNHADFRLSMSARINL